MRKSIKFPGLTVNREAYDGETVLRFRNGRQMHVYGVEVLANGKGYATLLNAGKFKMGAEMAAWCKTYAEAVAKQMELNRVA